MVWFLPILGGTLADRFGFRRALMFAYLVMTLGYYLLGSLSAPWMQPLRHALSDKWLVLAILLVPALGPGVVKPCVAGTTARASNETVRSLGYSIYYTIVNIGGAIGPILAFVVRKQLGLGIESVFRMAALSVFLMFWVTLIFYREPARPGEEKVASVSAALRNMFAVLRNGRFVIFLLISSGFYVVFWQEFISVPLFVRKYINSQANVDLLLSTDPIAVICFQILIAYLMRNVPAIRAIALGFLISAFSWSLLALHPTIPMVIVTLAVMALLRRSDPGSTLLRIYFAAGAFGTARRLHGLRVPARGHRLLHRRRSWRVLAARIRRRFGAPTGNVAGDHRDRGSGGGADVALRQNCQTSGSRCRFFLIKRFADVFDGLAGGGVARLDLQGLLKIAAGATDLAFGEVDASEIEVRIVPRIVAPGFGGALEPGNGFVVAVEID